MSTTLLSQPTLTEAPLPGEPGPDYQEIRASLHRLGAGKFGHAHDKSLCHHLLQTREILAHWDYPVWIQNAGALHSIYATDVYKRQLVSPRERASVQSFVGLRAERTVFLFCTLPRKKLFAALAEQWSHRGSRGAHEGIEVESDSGDVLATLDRQDIDSLVAIHMANEAEQAQAADGGPGLWLNRLSDLARYLSPAVPQPAFLRGPTELPSREQEQDAATFYSRGLQALRDGNRETAAENLSSSSACCSVWAEPTIWRAYLALRQGDLAMTLELTRVAREQLSSVGVAWDKRLTYREWNWLAAALERLATEGRRPFSARLNQRFASLIERFKFAGEEPAPVRQSSTSTKDAPTLGATLSAAGAPPSSGLPPRFQQYMELFAENHKNPKMFHYPSLPSQPFFPPETFPIVVDLEANFQQIQQEVFALDDASFHEESEKVIKRSGSWQVLMLYERGRKNEKNYELCPTVAGIIERHNTVKTLAGLMYVSKLEPGTVIQAHRGPTNLRLRCHLGIRIPEGDCGIKVGDQVRRWEEGKCLVFDDYYPHEAWNRTDEVREVLILDIWHPNLSEKERLLLEGLHRFAMAQTVNLNNYWSGNEKARRKNYD